MNTDIKIYLVTGGNGLIGKTIVAELRSKTSSRVVSIDINEETDLANDFIKCDITDPDSVRSTVSLVMKEYGRIDGLVNNAYPRTSDWGARFEDISLESWNKNIEMQLSTCFQLCQLVLPIMKAQKSGSIVNIASIYGVVGNDFTIYENTGGMTSPAAYSAIKGGVINFTRYLASYYGASGVRVNCVSPGGVFNNQNPEFVKQFEHKVPLKRMAKPEEIAPSIVFLLSDDASYITGHNLIVDGGWTAI